MKTKLETLLNDLDLGSTDKAMQAIKEAMSKSFAAWALNHAKFMEGEMLANPSPSGSEAGESPSDQSPSESEEEAEEEDGGGGDEEEDDDGDDEDGDDEDGDDDEDDDEDNDEVPPHTRPYLTPALAPSLAALTLSSHRPPARPARCRPFPRSGGSHG